MDEEVSIGNWEIGGTLVTLRDELLTSIGWEHEDVIDVFLCRVLDLVFEDEDEIV